MSIAVSVMGQYRHIEITRVQRRKAVTAGAKKDEILWRKLSNHHNYFVSSLDLFQYNFFSAELQNMLFTRRLHHVQCATSTLMNSYGSDVTFRLSSDQHANHNSSLSSQQSLHSLLRFAVLSQSAVTFRLDILSSKDNGFHFFVQDYSFVCFF